MNGICFIKLIVFYIHSFIKKYIKSCCSETCMVLESLTDPFKAENKPWTMFFIGILYSSVGISLSLWIFDKQASFVMVFLTTLAAVPIVYNTIKLEEDKDLKIPEEKKLMKEHNKAIHFFMMFFFGVVLSCVIWYVLLPSEMVGYVFQKQTSTISDINNQISGNSVKLTIFTKILFNNLKVLAFSLLFALIYCIGSIFILTWNATVIGTAIGNFIRSNISEYATQVGFAKFGGYLQIFSIGLFKYAIHGIPEILAYFYAGLAGGILSVAIVKKHYNSQTFNHILWDTCQLLILAIFFLITAAILEVWVTPLIF